MSDDCESTPNASGVKFWFILTRRRREGTHGEHLICGERLDLRLAHGDHVNRFPYGVEDLKAVPRFLPGASGMIFDDGHHVAATQSMLRQVFSESDPGVEIKLHHLSGNSVTNFVSSVASSFIQIDTTRKTCPFGPVNVPRIRNFDP